MSIRKRKWTTGKGIEKTAWIVDYFNSADVRRLKTFGKKKEADAFAATAKVEVREGVHVADGASVSVKTAGENWILTCKNSGLEKSTTESYQLHLDRHIVPFLGRMLLSKLSVPVIRSFQDQMRSGNPSLDDGDLRKVPRSPAMVKRVTTALGGILADAQERGYVARNAVREMAKGRRKGKGQMERRQKARLHVGSDIPAPHEISLILGAVQGRYRPFLLTAIFTGLRASELRGLRWSDVDLAEKVLHVRQRADKFHAIGMPKSDAGQRSIPLPPTVLNTLREWKLECPKGKFDLVFPNGEGNIEWHANLIKRGLIPAQLKAGVTVDTGKKDTNGKPILQAKYTGLHALRHFFASWCINLPSHGGLGLPPKVVQERMGHSSITMTMDVYGHLFPNTNDDEALATAELRLLSAANAT